MKRKTKIMNVKSQGQSINEKIEKKDNQNFTNPQDYRISMNPI